MKVKLMMMVMTMMKEVQMSRVRWKRGNKIMKKEKKATADDLVWSVKKMKPLFLPLLLDFHFIIFTSLACPCSFFALIACVCACAHCKSKKRSAASCISSFGSPGVLPYDQSSPASTQANAGKIH